MYANNNQLNQLLQLHENDDTVIIVHDGGSKRNPGPAYGSFAVFYRGQRQMVTYADQKGLTVRMDFGVETNNVAEHLTMLQAAGYACELAARSPRAIDVVFCSDSQLLMNKISGAWEEKYKDNETLFDIRCDILELIEASQIRTVEYKWIRKSEGIEDALGH
jgi:ribonuclease HI